VASMKLLQEKCEGVLKNTPILGQLCELATNENPLKIVFAIDEGSTCKHLVGSIIDDQDKLKKAIAGGLQFDTDTFRVRFVVVGGTGAATGTIGSNNATSPPFTQQQKVILPTCAIFFLEIMST
jgi:hypothetical protein